MATVKKPQRGTRPMRPPNNVSLIMECVEDDLSPAQAAAFSKAEKEYKTIEQKIANLKTNSNTYITQLEKHDDPVPELDILKNYNKSDTGQTVISPLTPTTASSTVSTLRSFKPTTINQNRLENSSNGPLQGSRVPDTGAQSAIPSSNDSAGRVLQTKQPDIVDFSFSSIKYIQLFPSLGVHVASRRQTVATFQHRIKELDERVKAYINIKGSEIPKWLTALGILTQLPTCKAHPSAPMTLQCIRSDKNGGLLKGSKWGCPNCSFSLPLHAGSALCGFGLDLEFMIRLIYYWTIQAPLVTVIKECLNSPVQINKVYTWLRNVCSTALDGFVRFNNDDMKVEIAMECLGPCKNEQDVDVVCLFERRTMFVVLKALPSHNKNIAHLVRDVVQKHVDKKVVLYATTKLPPKEGMNLPNQIKYKLGPTDARHVPLSQWYIRSVKSNFVGKMKQLEFKTIQSFLDEICWRDTRGHTSPTHAFHQILQHAKEAFKGKGKTVGNSSPEVILLDDDDKDPSPFNKRPSDGATPAAKKRKEDEVVDVPREPQPLESYYYGTKDAENMDFELMDKSLKFKCPVCKKLIENNIKMQRHVLAHIEVHRQQNMDLVDLTKCKYCFQEFETPFLMQCHVEKVHLEGSNSLACRICECAFQTSTELIQHAQSTHRQLEMPYSCECCHYRCSFYKKLLEHFESVHNGGSQLQCQYCLKVFFYTKNSATTYYWHMFKHQSRTVVRKCSSCCLTFVTPQDFQQHRTADHESQRGLVGVHKCEVKVSAKVIMIRPPMTDTNRTPKIKIVRIKSGQATGSTTSSQQRRSDKPPLENMEYPSLRLINVKNSKCVECLTSMTSESHFRKFLYCSTCRFATFCSRAFGEHRSWAHKEKTSSRKLLHNTHKVKATTLEDKLHCACGQSTDDGNELAEHLVGCGKWTAYPTWKEALDASKVMEEEAFSVTDVWIHTNRKQDEKKSSPVPPPPPTSEEEENPNMLSMLGLMRRHVPTTSKPADPSPSLSTAASLTKYVGSQNGPYVNTENRTGLEGPSGTEERSDSPAVEEKEKSPVVVDQVSSVPECVVSDNKQTTEDLSDKTAVSAIIDESSSESKRNGCDDEEASPLSPSEQEGDTEQPQEEVFQCTGENEQSENSELQEDMVNNNSNNDIDDNNGVETSVSEEPMEVDRSTVEGT